MPIRCVGLRHKVLVVIHVKRVTACRWNRGPREPREPTCGSAFRAPACCAVCKVRDSHRAQTTCWHVARLRVGGRLPRHRETRYRTTDSSEDAYRHGRIARDSFVRSASARSSVDVCVRARCLMRRPPAGPSFRLRMAGPTAFLHRSEGSILLPDRATVAQSAAPQRVPNVHATTVRLRGLVVTQIVGRRDRAARCTFISSHFAKPVSVLGEKTGACSSP